MRRPARPRARDVAFWAGAVALVVAALPTLDEVAHETFTGHMTQHLLFLVAAPLLLVAGDGAGRVRRALPPRHGRRAARAERRLSERPWLVLASALVVHGAVIGVWHLPGAYDAALDGTAWHLVEHATLLAGGLWFWWAVFEGGRRAEVGAVVVVFLGALEMGAVAALLTWAPDAFYTSHRATAPMWGLTPLGDQQVGGAVMWTVGGASYVAAGVVLFARWLHAAERRARLLEAAARFPGSDVPAATEGGSR